MFRKRANQTARATQASTAIIKHKKGFLEMVGEIKELLPSATFKVKLENGHEILAYLSGKMRLHRIKILPGDQVVVEMTPYDLTKGRIIFRY